MNTTQNQQSLIVDKKNIKGITLDDLDKETLEFIANVNKEDPANSMEFFFAKKMLKKVRVKKPDLVLCDV